MIGETGGDYFNARNLSHQVDGQEVQGPRVRGEGGCEIDQIRKADPSTRQARALLKPLFSPNLLRVHDPPPQLLTPAAALLS